MSGPFHLHWVFFCRRIQGVQFLLCVEMRGISDNLILMYAIANSDGDVPTHGYTLMQIGEPFSCVLG